LNIWAAGLPVGGHSLPSLDKYREYWSSSARRQFLFFSADLASVTRAGTGTRARARMRYAGNSWDSRVEQILSIGATAGKILTTSPMNLRSAA